MPLLKSASPSAIGPNIRREQGAGKPYKQALAIALHTQDAARQHRAGGGGLSSSPSFPERQAEHDLSRDSFHPQGLFASSVAGRTDRLPHTVAADSFVMPADAVGILGQGNTLAGAKLMDGIMKGTTGPYGSSIVHPPGIRRADGGSANENQPGISHVMVAGGETLIHPTYLKNIGWRMNGAKKPDPKADLNAGHKWAREFVARLRKHEIKRLKSAPKPKK